MKKIDMDKLETAIVYVKRMKRGVNPATNTTVFDQNTMKNPKVMRCMQFIEEVLEEVLAEQNKRVAEMTDMRELSNRYETAAKNSNTDKKDFPIEILQYYRYREDVTITQFVKQINEPLNTREYKELSYKPIMHWLKAHGYLKIELDSKMGRRVTIPTTSGYEVGITSSISKNSRGEKYVRITYGKDAQQFLIKNLSKILAEEEYKLRKELFHI